MKSMCIICFDCWDVEDDSEDLTDVKLLQNRNKNKFLFHNFCRNFQIPLKAAQEWDFAKENPFCQSCQESAETFVRLHQQLRSIKKAIDKVEQLVQNKIIQSGKKLQLVDHDTMMVIQNSAKDKRVKFFRDIVVGPSLSIPKLEIEPKYAKLGGHDMKQEIFLHDVEAAEENGDNFAMEYHQNNPEPVDVDENSYMINDSFFEGGSPEYLPSDSGDDNNCPKVDLAESMKRRKKSYSKKGGKGKAGTLTRKIRKSATDSKKIDSGVIISSPTTCKEEKSDVICEEEVDNDHVQDGDDFFREESPVKTRRVTRPLKKKNYAELVKSYKDSEVEDSSSDDDDDRDDYFILPDDAVETMKEDSKLERKVASALRPKDKDSSGRGTKKLRTKKTNEDGKYEYGGFEFFGDAESGYGCSLCPQTKCKQLRGITQHIRHKHIDTDGHACEICAKVMATSEGLKKHLATHQRGDGVICQYCGGSYTDTKGLELHISLVHFPEYKFPCDCCGKKFRQVNQLNKHKRAVHFKEKRFYCDRCSKGFFESGALHMHLKTHSTDKPYSCEFCSQKFNRDCHRKRHIKQFHELKVTDNSLQNKELRVSTNYAKLAILRESQPEIVKDVDEMAFESLKCQHCGLQYNRQNNLTRHLLQIHNIDVKGLAWKSRRPPSSDTIQKKGKKVDVQASTSTNEEERLIVDTQESMEQDVESESDPPPPSSSTKPSNDIFITLPNWSNSDHQPIQIQIPGSAIGERFNQIRRHSVWNNPGVSGNSAPPNLQNRLYVESSKSASTSVPHQFPS